VADDRSVTVEIPGGIASGQRIRLSGRGSDGPRGGPTGHLLVDVIVGDDERFLRDGDDLVTVLDVTMTEAALGCERSIGTVDGDDVTVEIASGTQPGEVISIEGRGVTHLQGRGRGDMRVVVNVRVPTHLSSEQESLLHDLAALDDDRTYGEPEGMVGRLRRLFRT
jgi:molecular chaperone DnaJ